MTALLEEWKNITAALDGVRDSVLAFDSMSSKLGSDYYGLTNTLFGPMLKGTIGQMKNFVERHAQRLPPSAQEAMRRIEGHAGRIGDAGGLPGVAALLGIATAGHTQISDLLWSEEERFAPVVDRAFAHLQRSIVADEAIRGKWQDAFRTAETRCESLGACHLLQHGIWAFKAHAAGERTDLVFQTPLLDEAEPQATASRLVLTEWKRIRDDQAEAPGAKLAEAKTQARLYGAGILGGAELTKFRYVVAVSWDALDGLPGEESVAGLTYRTINIAVNRSTPAVLARQ